MQVALQDRYWRNYFHEGRNLWMSLLGATLWGIAWRLRGLHARGMFVQPPKAAGGRGLVMRSVYIVLGLAFLLVADLREGEGPRQVPWKNLTMHFPLPQSRQSASCMSLFAVSWPRHS